MRGRSAASLFGAAAVLGGVAACAWPLVVLVTRVRRVRVRLVPGGFEADWDLADRPDAGSQPGPTRA